MEVYMQKIKNTLTLLLLLFPFTLGYEFIKWNRL